MKNHAFTLIELLVVVLIIGILSAIALPQYQKAVMRGRYATLKNLARSIANAEEIYYLANGKYSVDFNELDVSMPGGTIDYEIEGEEDMAARKKREWHYNWGYCQLADGEQQSQVQCQNDLINMRFQIRLQHSKKNPGRSLCIAEGSSDENSLQGQVCKVETGRSSASNINAGENPYTSWWY